MAPEMAAVAAAAAPTFTPPAVFIAPATPPTKRALSMNLACNQEAGNRL